MNIPVPQNITAATIVDGSSAMAGAPESPEQSEFDALLSVVTTVRGEDDTKHAASETAATEVIIAPQVLLPDLLPNAAESDLATDNPIIADSRSPRVMSRLAAGQPLATDPRVHVGDPSTAAVGTVSQFAVLTDVHSAPIASQKTSRQVSEHETESTLSVGQLALPEAGSVATPVLEAVRQPAIDTTALVQSPSTLELVGTQPIAASPVSSPLAEQLGPTPAQPELSSASQQIDALPLIRRVARAVASAHDSGGEIRLRLSPPELGALSLEVRVSEGVLVARLETETTVARAALIDNMPVLRERLAEQGVRIERFDVDLMQRQPSGTPDRSSDQRFDQPAPLPAAAPPVRRLPQVAEGVIARTTVINQDQRRLNVIV